MILCSKEACKTIENIVVGDGPLAKVTHQPIMEAVG